MKGGERFTPVEVARNELNGFILPRSQATPGVVVDRKIDGLRILVEQIQGPDVQRPAGQVNARGSLGFDGHLVMELCIVDERFRPSGSVSEKKF